MKFMLLAQSQNTIDQGGAVYQLPTGQQLPPAGVVIPQAGIDELAALQQVNTGLLPQSNTGTQSAAPTIETSPASAIPIVNTVQQLGGTGVAPVIQLPASGAIMTAVQQATNQTPTKTNWLKYIIIAAIAIVIIVLAVKASKTKTK